MTFLEEKPQEEKKGENGTDAVPASNGSSAGDGKLERRDPRFGGLRASVEASIASSTGRDLGNFRAPFPVSAADLGNLSGIRTREALIEILDKGVEKTSSTSNGDSALHGDDDPEDPSLRKLMRTNVLTLIERMKQDELDGPFAEHTVEYEEAEKNAELAANILTSLLLRSSPETGIDPREVEHRREVFGSNALTEKKLESFLELCWGALQDFVLIMLIVLGVISIVVEVTTHEGDCTTCWIEGAAILVSVCIVVFVTAGIDYVKQFAFIRLTKSLHETNTKAVIRMENKSLSQMMILSSATSSL